MPARADRLPEFFADADLTIVPGAGHFLPVEAPQVFADVILRRLGAVG